MARSSPNGSKTLWEKEKLFITSNFSFFHSVFERLVLQTHKNQGLFGKGLISTKKIKTVKMFEKFLKGDAHDDHKTDNSAWVTTVSSHYCKKKVNL